MSSAVAVPPAPVPIAAEGLRRLLRGRRARAIAYGCVLAELGLVIGFAIAYRPFDLSIYLWGGSAVTHGMRLYLVAPRANWFTYPPFAAAVFTPLAALPPVVVGVAWELASVAALAWSCLLALKLAGLAFLGYMAVCAWPLESRPSEGRELAVLGAPNLERLATSDAVGTLSSYDLS